MAKNIKHKTYITALIIFVFYFLLHVLVVSTAIAQSEASIESSTSTAVRDKVRQAIENLSHKPRAVMGVLDQVSETTLQLKLADGKSAQVATNGDTSYSRVTKGKRTDIKFNDLAIGDFTVALGYKNGNDILEAKRVISFDQEPTNSNRIFFATVQELNKGSISVTTKAGEDWTVETKNTTTLGKVNSTKDLNTGDQIIVAGVPSEKKDKTIAADKIFVLGIATAPKATATPSSSPKPTPKASSTPKP